MFRVVKEAIATPFIMVTNAKPGGKKGYFNENSCGN